VCLEESFFNYQCRLLSKDVDPIFIPRQVYITVCVCDLNNRIESTAFFLRRTWCRRTCRLTPRTSGGLLILHRSRCMIREPRHSRLVGIHTTSWSEARSCRLESGFHVSHINVWYLSWVQYQPLEICNAASPNWPIIYYKVTVLWVNII
jgi:hypothetical protein